jgi:hypothetical protein
MTGHGTTRRAFSLIETVVATLILSGAVVTLGAISTNVLRQGTVNRHYEIAASVIERQFAMIDTLGIDAFIESGQLEGIYDQEEPGYKWSVETKFRNVDDLYLVTMTVQWMEGAKPYRLAAQTTLNGTNGVSSSSTTTSPSAPASPAEGSPGPGGPSS